MPKTNSKANIRDAADDVTEAAKAVEEDIRQARDTVAEESGEQAQAFAEKAKETAHAAGDIWNTDGLTEVAGQFAENISNAARNADFGAIQNDVSEFARKNPLLFFGGAAALGFVAGRMLKSSERAEMAHDDGEQPLANLNGPRGETEGRWGYS